MQATFLDTIERPQTTTSKHRSAPLSPMVADRLLELLSTDDVFRKLMTRDPHEALCRVGFVNTTDLPSPADCKWGIKLASKEAIAVARDEIRTMGSVAPQAIHKPLASERIGRKDIGKEQIDSASLRLVAAGGHKFGCPPAASGIDFYLDRARRALGRGTRNE